MEQLRAIFTGRTGYEEISGIGASDPKVEQEYWGLIEQTVFANRRYTKKKG
jgi:hypothetical protein